MSNRRTSSRARKQVDYAQSLKDFEDDDDDDFASGSAPPTKKTKSSKSQATDSKTSKQQRAPLDEKLFERDTRLALQISRQTEQLENRNNDASVILPVTEQSSGDLQLEMDSLKSKEVKVSVQTVSSVNSAADDDDYCNDDDDDETSDDNFSGAESSDSEFSAKKVSKAKVNKGHTKTQKSATTKLSSRSISQGVVSTSAKCSSLQTSSIVTKVHTKSSVARAQKVTAKSPVVQAVYSIKSSTGATQLSPLTGLRLGLSRNVRVKPLHRHVLT